MIEVEPIHVCDELSKNGGILESGVKPEGLGAIRETRRQIVRPLDA
jgi:hypothetical protein